jgi:hypothetical protein
MGSPVAKEQGGEGDALKHFLLWAGAVAAPIAWAVQFLIIYALVPHVCKVGASKSLHITSATFIVLGILAGILSWWNLGQKEHSFEEERESIIFMGRLGIMNSALFTLIMLAQVIPTFFIDPCWQ